MSSLPGRLTSCFTYSIQSLLSQLRVVWDCLADLLAPCRTQTDKKTLGAKTMMQEIKDVFERRNREEAALHNISAVSHFTSRLQPHLSFPVPHQCVPNSASQHSYTQSRVLDPLVASPDPCDAISIKSTLVASMPGLLRLWTKCRAGKCTTTSTASSSTRWRRCCRRMRLSAPSASGSSPSSRSSACRPAPPIPSR